MQNIICFPIKLYRYILSPFLRPCCRFYPSCSQYALTAIETFGIGKGLRLACWRLLRCNPWSAGGYDPVLPDKEEKF
ncbi:membrane protein insertion efficiency factor YidD [Legionella septentrionalis]